MKKNKLIIILIIFVGSIHPVSLWAQTKYQDYYQSWSYNDFLPAPVNGGGSVSVSIANDRLSVRFSAGFQSSPLKTGSIKQLNTSPMLPDMVLGQIGDYYTAYIQSGWLCIRSDASYYTGFNQSFLATLNNTQDYNQSWSYNDFLPAPVNGGGSVSVSIANNQLSVRFSAGFQSSPLKTGNIKQLNTSPILPDMTLGDVGTAYTAYIRSGWLCLSSHDVYCTGFDELYEAALSFNFNYTTTENFIETVDITESGVKSELEAQTAKGIRTVQYFDGLGRLKQSIAVDGSPGKKDIITSFTYDDYGREEKQYLPFAAARNGAYCDSPTAVENFSIYGPTDDDYAYSQIIYEASPLDRVFKQVAPGYNWRNGSGHEVKLGYGTNSASEVMNYAIETNGLLKLTALAYPAGSLYKTTVWGENNIESANTSRTVEFKDKQGRIVLRRNYDGTTAFSTYYVYNDWDLLCCVIPPKAAADDGSIDSTELDQLCYQYKYDERNRLIERKLPGTGWEYLIYDARDRLVLTQDAKLRGVSTNRYHYTLYDNLNRAVEQGLCTETTDYSTLRGTVKASSNYTTTARNSYLYTYYDDYSWSPPSGYAYTTVYNQHTRTNNVKGLVTGTKTKLLETGTWLYTVNYYDKYGRLLQQYQSNPEGGYNRESYAYNFKDQVTTKQTYHKKTSSSMAITLNESFMYDHMGRTLSTKFGYNTTTLTSLSTNEYDDLGRLKTKRQHNGMQYSDYAYNIRGWLTRINDPETASTDARLFALQLYYDTDMTTSMDGGAQFNGNINGMKWRLYNGGSNQYKGYNFTYDGLNRLTKGDYGTYSGSWANTPAYDLTSVTYDANGNITALTRKNSGGTDKDNFSFTLNGNQLGSISGTSNGNYSYDTNGNVTEDRPKGLSVSYYHELDLPRRYYYYLSAYSVFYQHDATGVKWSKRNFVSGMSDTTLYYGPFIYESGTLSKVLTPEGYYEPSTGRYHYYLKDHLGNTRITYYYSGSTSIVVQEVEYYPFGSLFSDNNLDKNRYLYQGKELENEMGFGIYDFHVRGYDPNIIRTRQLDPKAESYYSWSPYSWAANNPINFIDPDGREVKPAGNAELIMIQNTLPKEARNYVRLDKNGSIDQKLLNSYGGESLNFNNLKTMVNSDRVVEVRLDDKFTFMGQDGQLGTATMSYSAFDPQYDTEADKDLTGETMSGLSTGESGFMGKTLFPDKEGIQNSPNENIIVIVNKNLSPAGAAENYSHEANGHALLYILNGGNHKGASHQPVNGQWIEGNTILKDMIINSKKETIKNMQE